MSDVPMSCAHDPSERAQDIQDIKDTAANLGWRGERFLVALEVAVLTERERCAVIAEALASTGGLGNPDWDAACHAVAEHIRTSKYALD